MSEPEPAARKIAILGGGCGGLAAAWELSQPGREPKREVTVYQLGWRLGGKGASGRAPIAPGQPIPSGQRIEEHGLHLWFGFYRHAFGMLQDAYRELGRNWEGAFEAVEQVRLYGRQGGALDAQALAMRRRRGPPLAAALAAALRHLGAGVRAEFEDAHARSSVGAQLQALDRLAEEAERLARGAQAVPLCDEWVALPEPTGDARPLRAPAWTVNARGKPEQECADTHALLRRAGLRVGGLLLSLGAGAMRADGARRLLLHSLELAWATFRGLHADRVLWHGLGSLDDWDLREWLTHHGASARVVRDSALLRGLYDLTFAYLEGDRSRPALAAGKGLQALALMLDYEDAFMYRMSAGMGDVVFAPLYLALRRRGVRFEFFTRIDELALSDGALVRIAFTRQATVRAGAHAYQPLVDVDGMCCWPNQPLYEQLDDGAAVRGVDFERDERVAGRPGASTCTSGELLRGQHFDEVVLAIPVGALRAGTPRLVGASPRVRAMLERSRTCATKALQLWLTLPPGELQDPPLRHGLAAPSTGGDAPFDTCCDMSQLLLAERWHRSSPAPEGIAHLCAVLADADAPGQLAAEGAVRAAAREQLRTGMKPLWPGAYDEGGFLWGVLFDPRDRAGEERLDAQYMRANVTAGERYVQTPPGSVAHRLWPWDAGCSNLVLAGDWTRSVIDGGCVEAAVISGVSAARALQERPELAAAPAPGPECEAARSAPAARCAVIEHGALASAPGPLECERAALWCFWLRSDRRRVEQLLARVLTDPDARWQYRPLLDHVILTCGVLEGLRSTHPDFADLGALREPEVAIWVPVVGERRNAGAWVRDHLAVFMPYVLVDEPLALLSGREVYGFAKSQGWLSELPGGWPASAPLPNPPARMSVEAPGADRGPWVRIERRRLITIAEVTAGSQRGGLSAGSRGGGVGVRGLAEHFLPALRAGGKGTGRALISARGDPHSLTRSIRALATDAPKLVRAIHQLLGGEVRIVFRKQVRDAADGRLAALSQLVEARARVRPGSLRWRALGGERRVEIEALDSHPLGAELGLASQTTRLAFAASFAFTIGPGEVLWSAGLD